MSVRFYRIIFSCLLLTCCITPTLFAQRVQTVNGAIQLPAFDTGNDAIQRSAAGRSIVSAALDTALPYSYVLLSFKAPLSAEDQQAITEAGIRLISWVPDNAYIARVSAPKNMAETLTALLRKRNIKTNGIGKVPLELKIENTLFPYVSKGQSLPEAISGKGIEIHLYDAADLPVVLELLNKQNVRRRPEKTVTANGLIIQSASGAVLRAIARSPYVASISIFAGEPQPEWNFKMQVNGIYPVNYDLTGPTGNGTYFGNFETYGADPRYELDYKNRRNLTYNSTAANGHGSDVSFIVGAANNFDEQYRGMAPGATLLKLSWLSGVEDLYTNKNFRPLVSNYSVGWGVGNLTYDDQARKLDSMARSLGAYLHCFSAGNDGGATNATLGYGAGWANITGRVKTNKNNLTVHSTDYPGVQTDWTSKGPVTDGRLKPDICAQGWEGSSYASPGVGGLIAVLYEAYNTSYSTSSPRSDVVKVVILNTASDLDKKGIDYKTGFGEINPSRALKMIQDKRIITDTASTTTPRVYTLTVPTGTNEARMMLYWHDFPGTVGAAKALVNNLDLQVVTPAGDTLLPWVLDHTVGKHYDLPLRKRDTLNNVEQVTIDNPAAGNYTVIVKGTLVPLGLQPFVVTYDWQPKGIKIINPTAGFRVAPGGAFLFTWNLFNHTAGTADSVDVFLQLSSAAAAAPIASLAYNRLYFNYTIPAGTLSSSTARLIVKQRNTGLADTSAFFQIAPVPQAVGFTTSCPATVTLRWDTLAGGVQRYIIYRLGDKYMTPIDSVAHPLAQRQLNASSFPGVGSTWAANEWFAVAARYANGALSLRSQPITQNQTHPLSPAYLRLNKTYSICYGDTARLHTGYLKGDSTRWYKDGVPLETGPTLAVTRSTGAGNYQFKVFTAGCTYTSDTIKITSSVNIADTATWGASQWKVYAFAQANLSKYYGTFTIKDSLSINSDKFYPWAQWPQNAAGYTGCNLTTKPFYTVYKRKGFESGTYRINLLRADRQMKLWVDGVLVYTSPLNAFTVNNIWTGTLGANSTIRVEHYTTGGSHVHFRFERTDLLLSAAENSLSKLAATGEQPAEERFSLSPNPAKDYFYINTGLPLKGDAWVTITDVSGVMQKQVKFAQGAHNLRLDIAALNAGLYFIKIQQNGKTLQVLKLVKQ